MMGRMSLAQCCCGCEDCCNGSYPSEYDLDLTIADSDCGNCDTLLSGTYTLSPGQVPCGWYFGRSWSPNTEICVGDPYNPWYLLTQYIQLRIRCAGDTKYMIDAWMIVSGSAYFTIPNPFPWLPGVTLRMTVWNRWWWSDLVNLSDWSCTGATDYELPFAYQHWATNPNGPWNPFDSVYPTFCDGTGSTFSITAVP